MAEPVTEAGRRLAASGRSAQVHDLSQQVAMVERDARADLLTELRAAVEGLIEPRTESSYGGTYPGGWYACRAAVLALLEPPR